jgi:signal peptidase I
VSSNLHPTTDSVFRTRLRLFVFGRNLKFTLVRAAILAVTCVVILQFVLLPIRIDGISMQPTYQDGSINFVNCLAYLRHEPRRGDVVGIRLAGHHVMYMKRIVGLPGETIAFVGGHLSINGQLLAEPYEKYACDWNYGPVQLTPDEFFVVGDNRSMPKEDHYFGRCERERIVGKILL